MAPRQREVVFDPTADGSPVADVIERNSHTWIRRVTE
jgi:hypothetical protein